VLWACWSYDKLIAATWLLLVLLAALFCANWHFDLALSRH
jgi:hypothetical protein